MTKEIFISHVLFSEPSLYRISKSLLQEEADCEDAVQEAILKAYEKKDTLKDERYFNTWLIRILMNECYSILRKKSRFLPFDDDMEEMEEMEDEHVFREDEKDEMYQAVMKLPIKLRMSVVLFYVEGYSIEEMTSILKVPAGTVKSRLARGRKLLRRELERAERVEVRYGTV